MRAAVTANLRACLEVALSTNSGRYPSLQGFLHELANMQRATAEEAPDLGAIAEDLDAVRILTVHGAKGLEAPVVWLVDAHAGATRTDSYDVLVDWPPESDAPVHFSLFSRKDERGTSRALLFEQEAALAAREHINLLYVAMTRAQQVLIVSGCDAQERGESWYARIEQALDTRAAASTIPMTPEPGFSAIESAPPESELEGFSALQIPLDVGQRDDDLRDPRRRSGTLVHALLEKCVAPSAMDNRDLLRRTLNVSEAEFDALWRSARSIIEEPSLSRFFNPDQYLHAFNELAYVSADGELRRIDRVVEFPEEIWVLDYKTGEAAASVDPARAARPFLKQLEAYRLAVSELMPGKPVRSALVFPGGLFYET
jgi:ATP-dependent helicase/nuclease subunit A